MKRFRFLFLPALICSAVNAFSQAVPVSESQLRDYLSKPVMASQLSELCKYPGGYYPGHSGAQSYKIVSDLEQTLWYQWKPASSATPPALSDSYYTEWHDWNDIVSGVQFRRYQDMLRLVRNVNPTIVADAIYFWTLPVYDWNEFLNRGKLTVADLKAINRDIIVQACPHEFFDQNTANTICAAEGNRIPKFVTDAFGIAEILRPFNYANMYLANSGATASSTSGILDIRKTETQLWYYYVGCRYIDMGCESLNFCQVELTNQSNPAGQKDPTYWNNVIKKLRTYAAQSPMVRCLLVTGHTNNMKDGNGNLTFDFCEEPCRPSELTPGSSVGYMYVPQNQNGGCAELIPPDNASIYNSTMGGTNPSGWYSKRSYGFVFLAHDGMQDINYLGNAHRPPATLYWPYYWDEVSWYAMQSRSYKNDWLKYAWTQVKYRDNWIRMALPVMQPIVTDNHDFWYATDYYANDPDPSGALFPAVNTIGGAAGGLPDRNNIQHYAGFGQEQTIKEIFAGKYDLSYCTPSYYSYSFGSSGWTLENPRLTADVNGDGKDDIIAFGNDGVYVAYSTGSSYTAATRLIANEFNFNNGWLVSRHPRLVGDINGDGKADIVGFGQASIITALSTGTGFTAPTYVLNNVLCYASPVPFTFENPRCLADVNGDGKQDIVAFGNDGVYVSYSTCTPSSTVGTFSSPVRLIANEFNYNNGWLVSRHPRYVGDINGDGKADIVGFGDASIITALSTGTGFTTPTYVLNDVFCYNSSRQYRTENPRCLADVDGDGKQDIVAFGNEGTYVAFALSNPGSVIGMFATPVLAVENFNYNSGWRVANHLRLVGDVNNDGKADIVACGEDGLLTSLSIASGRSYNCIFAQPTWLPGYFGYNAGSGLWDVYNNPRALADIDGDGRKELVGFANDGVLVENCGPGQNAFRPAPLQENRANGLSGLSELAVYPNPVQDYLNIDINAAGDHEAQLSVYNVLGQPAGISNTVSVHEGKQTIQQNVGSLAPGIYLVDVKLGDKHYKSKFLKK